LQWLQDPSQIKGTNLNNIRHEARRLFRNKKKKYLKDKTNGLTAHSKTRATHTCIKE
jgi:hypothetical protein